MGAVKEFASFQNKSAHIVGQPFTLHGVGVPMNADLTCNCGGPEELTKIEIRMSVSQACKSCGRMFNAAFNPHNGKAEIQMAVPKPEGEPS